MPRKRFLMLPLVATLLYPAAPTLGADAHLMRYADVHHDHIVFTYEDDLWLVSTDGGPARRITSDKGTEYWARFSPDGTQIAFTASYDGGRDVYVMPTAGGPPTRLTYHPSGDRVLDWWPDGKSVLFRSTRAAATRGEQVFYVPVTGGLPQRLPVDRAGLTAVSPDGKQIAYNRITREHATWKRHRGGTAQDIWMGSLDQRNYRKIIDSDWSDNFPMWHATGLYFLSDRTAGTLNLYHYDLATGAITQLTNYTDYDVKYPSIGPDHIVYQYAESLHLLNLRDRTTRRVPIEIPTDSVRMRVEQVDVSPRTGSFGLSPDSVRLVLAARGEILNIPVEDGIPINLTRSSGSHDKNAAWSPDGRWIAFVSDRTGEEEIYLVDQKGEQPWRQLTHDGDGFRLHLVWSPDSKHLLVADKYMRLKLVDVDSGDVKVIDRSDTDDAWERWGIQDYVWSPDSKWVAYTKMESSQYESIFLYSVDSGQTHRLTEPTTQDWSPSFDPDGRYLYFLSNRTFHPIMGFVDQNHIFLDMTRPYFFLLDADAESPFAPEEQFAEETVADADDEADADADDDDDATDEDDEPTLDLDGLQQRLVVADGVPAGNYFRLEATDDGFLYLSKSEPEFLKYQTITDETTDRLDLYHYSLADAETKKVLGGIANYHLSAKGDKLVYRAGSTYGVVTAGASASVGDGKVSLNDAHIEVDRAAEFAQMFNEAWRIERDWFYDPNLHGVDWEAIREKYARFIPNCGDRSDLNYLIGEMIAELNIGHTYVGGGDIERDGKYVPVGVLGIEFAADAGSDFYRIAAIIPGTPGDPSERSPLAEPGCPIDVGDYLIAINGTELRVGDNPYRLLQNQAGKVVRLTYNDHPTADDAEEHLIETLRSERGIRYRAWVNHSRAHVDDVSDNRIGYVHLPDMMTGGLIEFAKEWFPSYEKQAFIIDVRYNGGGFTGDMIIDRIERELWGLSKPREGGLLRSPERAFHGPIVVLINEDTGSNGEMFAEAIKILDIAPLVGMRTWGGSIGIEPHQSLVDGGTVTPPQFGLYGLDRRWLIEGTGVIPDFEVQNMPGDVLRGTDAQLDTAIELLLDRLESEPTALPAPPAYPDKSRPHGS
jgi:tricorn protease